MKKNYSFIFMGFVIAQGVNSAGDPFVGFPPLEHPAGMIPVTGRPITVVEAWIERVAEEGRFLIPWNSLMDRIRWFFRRPVGVVYLPRNGSVAIDLEKIGLPIRLDGDRVLNA